MTHLIVRRPIHHVAMNVHKQALLANPGPVLHRHEMPTETLREDLEDPQQAMSAIARLAGESTLHPVISQSLWTWPAQAP